MKWAFQALLYCLSLFIRVQAFVKEKFTQARRLFFAQMPLDGLMLDLDQALLRSRVKDLIIYLHHKLKKVSKDVNFPMELLLVVNSLLLECLIMCPFL